MANATTSADDRSSTVHTEVRAPAEVVLMRVIWWVFGAIDVLIGLRFVLKLVGANAAAGFVQLVNGISGVFMAPFVAVLGTMRAAGAVFEWSALVAIAVYALVAWGITALIAAVVPRESAETVERTESNKDASAR